MLTSDQAGLAGLDPQTQQIARHVLSRIVAADSGDVQRVILFGSHAAGKGHGQSDVDVMVLVEPMTTSWGPEHNIAERRRLEDAVRPARARLDLWVRTVDQYEEARHVVGGIEYAAETGGVVVASRPARRAPTICRSADDIRYRNVCDRLEDARRLLGRSVIGTFATVIVSRSAEVRPPEHYAWRSTVAGMSAIFVWQAVDPPRKYDELTIWLRLLRELDPRAASALARA